MLEIDGSMGEGGGQVLRTSLALAAVTGMPFRIHSIRARRSRPGLARQHLASVQAVAEVCGARVEGAALRSTTLTFRPGPISPGHFHFSTGGAGSATLVLQALLPALLQTAGSWRVVVEGGTHTPSAPPFEFVAWTLLPLLRRMGAHVEVDLHRPGFYPQGGGRLEVRVEPGALRPLALAERGRILARRGRAYVSSLPVHIAERELATMAAHLSLDERALETVDVPDPVGPGNALVVAVQSAEVTEVFSGIGRRGVPAERVAEEVVDEVRQYEEAHVPVGPHLADQLLVPLALAGGGTFRTMGLTTHARTVAALIPRFLDSTTDFRAHPKGGWEAAVQGLP